MPKYMDSDEVGDIGVDLVSLAVKYEFSWIFRRQPENDLGIDGQIETVDSSREGSGRLIAVQIKAGDSFFKQEQEFGYVYYGDNKHLKYWLKHSLPVIIVICNPKTKICYWAEITRANIENTNNGWKVLVPKSQTLSSRNKYLLEEISQAPQHSDIVELLLIKFFNEKYAIDSDEGFLDIYPDIFTPANFEHFTHLAFSFKKNEFVYIGHYYNTLKVFGESDLLEFIEWRTVNVKQCSHSEGVPKILILVISENIDNLVLPEKLVDIIKSTPNLEVSRVIYRRTFRLDGTRFFSLNELDENDELIFVY